MTLIFGERHCVVCHFLITKWVKDCAYELLIYIFVLRLAGGRKDVISRPETLTEDLELKRHSERHSVSRWW